MDYLIKSSAIVALFYICYRLFLQRETFFESNRWFLVIGLLTATCLPFVVIPIYIEYTPVTSEPSLLVYDMVSQESVKTFNWISLLYWIYGIGLVFFSAKFIIELASLQRLIKNNPRRRLGRFSLIEIFDKIAPFSFFKWIVYNPKQFKKEELPYVINHEKVHAKEYHTLDVLIAQISCIIFWFNPLVWLYKKELQQNLEFIADKKAQTISDSKENYQRLLLKASVPNHPLALTNNFYNSLIKKRIIMLHKSKSNKLNAWKYAVIVPVLALFLMSFNTQKIYIAKDIEPKVSLAKEFIISPNTSDNQLDDIVNYFRNKSVKIKFSNITRNSDMTIKTLTLNTKHADGTDYTKRMTVSEHNNVIPSFKLVYNSGEDDIILNVLEDNSNTALSKHKVTFSDNKTTATQEINETPKTEEKIIGNNPLYVIGNKQYKKEQLPARQITTSGSVELLNKNDAFRRYGKIGNDGAVVVNGQANFHRPISVITARRGDIIITKDFSEADLNLAKAQLEKEGLKTKIRGVKRNSNGEIIAIKIEVSSEHSKASFNLNDDGPINPISIKFDNGGKNISIGSGRNQESHVYVGRANNLRSTGFKYRTRGRAHVVSGVHKNDCDSKCDHDNKVIYEFHSDDEHDGDNEFIVKGSNAYVIKSDNVKNGKHVVTVTDENGNDKVLELKSKDNVFVYKTKDGKVSSNNATWVSDKDGEVKYEIRTKKSGKSFFISTDDNETPYILLDGKEITKKEMDKIDSDLIKNINVLKGDSAIKEYGDKAKGGAIIITTKK